MNLVHGEFEFLEDVQHLTAHVARGADDGDPVTHRNSPISEGSAPYAL